MRFVSTTFMRKSLMHPHYSNTSRHSMSSIRIWVRNYLATDDTTHIVEEKLDPTAALRTFYKEDFEIKDNLFNSSPQSLDQQINSNWVSNTLSVENVLQVIRNECGDDTETTNISTYQRREAVSGRPLAEIILDLPSSRQRISLAETLIYKFKKLTNISKEGMDCKEVDWIVLDLGICLVHIFEPEARIEYALDEKLQTESSTESAIVNTSPEELVNQLAASSSRKSKRL